MQRDLHLHPSTLQILLYELQQMSFVFRSKLQLRSPAWFWRTWKLNYISRFTPLTWLPFNDLSKAKETFFFSVYFSFFLHYSDVAKSSEISWRNLMHKCILHCINFQMVSSFVLATHTRQGLLQDTIFSSFLSLNNYGNCSSASLSPYSLTASLIQCYSLMLKKERKKPQTLCWVQFC